MFKFQFVLIRENMWGSSSSQFAYVKDPIKKDKYLLKLLQLTCPRSQRLLEREQAVTKPFKECRDNQELNPGLQLGKPELSRRDELIQRYLVLRI